MKSRYSLNLGKPLGIILYVLRTFSLLFIWIVCTAFRQGLVISQILMHKFFILVLFLISLIKHKAAYSIKSLTWLVLKPKLIFNLK